MRERGRGREGEREGGREGEGASVHYLQKLVYIRNSAHNHLDILILGSRKDKAVLDKC